jgi:hypothetical protein
MRPWAGGLPLPLGIGSQPLSPQDVDQILLLTFFWFVSEVEGTTKGGRNTEENPAGGK